MNDDHIHAFVSECRESVTDLNNALLALEDDPTDDEAIESVFRTAHTLKGNFGAMGYENASELAHALEDLLDGIRDGEIAVTPEIMDAAFDGVDHIESIVDEVESTGETETDPTETIERLRATAEGGDAPASKNATEDDGDDEEAAEGHDFAVADSPPEFEDADVVAHAAVDVDPDGMLGVDGMLVLEAVTDVSPDIETAPDREAIEEGEYEGRFDVFLPGVGAAALREGLSNAGAVEAFEVGRVGPPAGDDEAGTEDGDGDFTFGATAADEEAPADGEDGSASEPGPEQASEAGDEQTAERASFGADASSEENRDDEAAATGTASGSDISSVRVDVDRLDELHSLVEQLVTGRITIRRAIEDGDLETAETSLNDFDKVTSRLQNTVMDMRLIPLRRVVSNLPRVVRDVAREQGTEVSFEMHGEDIELDRSILTEIEDPLIHVLRNAVDHGIESPDEREAAGKPREGAIELRAERQRDHVTIVVEDDGGGIDADAIRETAVEEGVVSESEAASMPDDDVYDLVFHPGFSTAEEVTDVSGRGVGMDVVHSTVDQLDGSVDVDSELGEGTRVELRLPVSVAIVDVLFVTVGQMEYGIPIKNIDELTHAADIETVNGDEVVRHDDDVYPVLRLADALDVEGETALATDGGAASDPGGDVDPPGDGDGQPNSGTGTGDDGMLVRIRDSVRPVALRCDAFTDHEEVVVKPLKGSLSGIPGLSGTAILGDGNIVPILDVVSLEA